MAFYYKIENPLLPTNGIQICETKMKKPDYDQSIAYDFSKHVLIELLDDVTPETKLWEELGLATDKSILHKRMMVDSHRVHCRRAVVVCANPIDAKNLVKRVSQSKIIKRCVCAAVVQDLLFDFKLFEKQILRLGDQRPQHQLLYVSDLNRCREPAVLTQYLIDLFSPFGTVLSVFVSEDKDGFAHPEGVVKFAHLSEAFAAELAYDQFIVGMERLSVTTHHNILLSQCDLRVRLREAQRRYCETLNYTPPPGNHLFDTPEVHTPKDSSMENGLHFAIPNQCFTEHESPDDKISHSTELSDALKYPCKSNLIECLKSMALCSESSATRETLTEDLSCSSRTSFNIIQPSMVTLPLKEQHWSSRISNWIADIPNNDFSKSHNDNSVSNHNNFVHLDEPVDCTSSLCSFITCDNGSKNCTDDPMSYQQSIETCVSGSLNDSNETILSVALSPKSYDTTKDNFVDITKCTLTQVQPHHSVSTSMSQNANNSCSGKLSLKRQKFSSTLISNSQKNLRLSEVSKSKLKDPKISMLPVVRLKRLSFAEIQNYTSQTNALRALNNQRTNCDSDEHSVSLILSDKENNLYVNRNSTVRNSGLFSHQTSSHSNLVVKNKTQLKLAPRSICPYKSGSPLKAWLKNDLQLASNVNVFENVENPRKIICATSNKNVLAHVGCSNMTCDICYPGSTNLLFGCH